MQGSHSVTGQVSPEDLLAMLRRKAPSGDSPKSPKQILYYSIL